MKGSCPRIIHWKRTHSLREGVPRGRVWHRPLLALFLSTVSMQPWQIAPNAVWWGIKIATTRHQLEECQHWVSLLVNTISRDFSCLEPALVHIYVIGQVTGRTKGNYLAGRLKYLSKSLPYPMKRQHSLTSMNFILSFGELKSRQLTDPSKHCKTINT